jgi:hypothetical protein
VVLVLWFVYPASAYLAGHPPIEDAGFQGAVATNVVERVGGTPGHLLVVQLRVGLTVVLWLLAAAGAVREWRRGRLDIRVAILAAAPLMLFPVQSYGGEMLIRVSLFALPFIALLACSALLPTDGSLRLSIRRATALVLTFVVLAVLNVTGRFGNTEYDLFSDSEMAAVTAVQRLAPPGSAIISAAHPTPWRDQTYLEHQYRTIDDLCSPDLSAGTCGPIVYNFVRHNPQGAFLMFLRSSEASIVLQGESTTEGFAELEEWLSAQNGVRLAFSNAEARVYRMTP